MRFALLGWILGIACIGFCANLPNRIELLCFTLVTLIVYISCLAYKHHKYIEILAKFLYFLLGLTLGVSYVVERARFELLNRLPQELEGQTIQVKGVVHSLPQYYDVSSHGQSVRFQFKVQETSIATWHPTTINVFWGYAKTQKEKDNINHLAPGQIWQFELKMKAIHGLANGVGFDNELGALSEGISASGSVRNQSAIYLRQTNWWDWQTHLQALRFSLAKSIEQSLENAEYKGVIVALVIGEQRGIAQDDWALFNKTGIGHLISISGSHITMLAGIAAFLILQTWRWLGSPLNKLLAHLHLSITKQQLAKIAAVTVALTYCLLAGWGIPAQRTFLMLLIFAWGFWRKRKINVAITTLMALAIVLLLDPWALFLPGTWLSFVAVCLIFWIASQIGTKQMTVKQKTLAACHMQIMLSLGMLPLSAWFFQQMSLVSPIANFIAIPVVTFLIVPIALLGALIAYLFNWSLPLTFAHEIFSLMVSFLKWCADLPYANMSTAQPSLTVIVMACLAIVAMNLPWLGFWRVISCVFLLNLFFQPSPKPPPNNIELIAFDIGQGMAVLIQTNQHILLYDTGPKLGLTTSQAQRTILPLLKQRGINSIDALIVSHRDADHSGGVNTIKEAIDIKQTLTSMTADDPIIQGWQNMGQCLTGQTWHWDGATFEFLHPTQAFLINESKTNARSCVLKISFGDASILLAGDIENAQEGLLVETQKEKLQSHILFAPHHGSKTSSSIDFLEAVKPQYVIFQVGYQNQFHHPHPTVWQRYREQHIQRWRTDFDGAIYITLSKNEKNNTIINIKSERENHCRYWMTFCGMNDR